MHKHRRKLEVPSEQPIDGTGSSLWVVQSSIKTKTKSDVVVAEQ